MIIYIEINLKSANPVVYNYSHKMMIKNGRTVLMKSNPSNYPPPWDRRNEITTLPRFWWLFFWFQFEIEVKYTVVTIVFGKWGHFFSWIWNSGHYTLDRIDLRNCPPDDHLRSFALFFVQSVGLIVPFHTTGYVAYLCQMPIIKLWFKHKRWSLILR